MNAKKDVLKVMKLCKEAITPKKGSAYAAGYDLSSAHDTVIPARGKGLVKTGLAIAVPSNCYARVAPRSGLAVKHFIDTGAGVIDMDYRGEVGVVLFNHSEKDFEVKYGDRVAQLILEKISYAELEEVDELPATERGAGGFGSTGVSETIKRQKICEPEVEDEVASSVSTTELLASLSNLNSMLSADECAKLRKAVMCVDTFRFQILSSLITESSKTNSTENLLQWINAISEN